MGRYDARNHYRRRLIMCGIAGFINKSKIEAAELTAIASSMARKLTHRGPNGSGVWADAELGIGLAHQRLAIIDLSPAGNQPMTSKCGRFVLVFNGEIYNHQKIRQELKQVPTSTPHLFEGHSDTETILAAISQWGLEFALNKCVGMFALALWDKREHSLHLARDRVGEKPLYYGLYNGNLLFGSELKAITSYPGFNAEINRNALAQYLQYNFIPAPNSIYQGIYKLPPGSHLKVTKNQISQQILPEPLTYWSLSQVASKAQKNPFRGGEDLAVLELERLLSESISDQIIADVPLGAFLSGGIDSSTVVALMQSLSDKPVKSFTIGFAESNYDESKHAQQVAKHIGTDHTELFVSPDQALDVIPKLPTLYDEPFADVSQIPTFLVSTLASKDVTVCLSGDGGDELFGGYNRHINGSSLWRKVNRIPHNIRNVASQTIKKVPQKTWESAFRTTKRMIPKAYQYNMVGEKMHKIGHLLSAESGDQIYNLLLSKWHESERILADTTHLNTAISNTCPSEIRNLEQRMMFMDTAMYLPDDILVKIDRAAMGASLETRVPMLDHRLIEFAWTLPIEMNIRGSQGKRLLRKLLYRHVPAPLIERPKAGFSVPIDDWLRGPLRDWAEDLLDHKKISSEGYFCPEVLRRKWDQHTSGKYNWGQQLWSITTFQAWLQAHKTNG